MSIDTLQERFFESAFELGVDARENGYESPLIIVFSDQANRVACILTIKDLGTLLSRETLEWDCSGWIWEWEPGYADRVYDGPFRAALTSSDGRTLAECVPLLSLSEESDVEIARRTTGRN